jgi:hypothetical protein
MNWKACVPSAVTVFLAAFSISGCFPFYARTSDGLQPEFASHVPARTAVLPCQEWWVITKSSPEDIPAPDDRKNLCTRLDEAVLEGFRAQPYMRGFSPKVVDKLLEQAKWSSAVSEGFAILADATNSFGCKNTDDPFCGSAATLYRQTLAQNAAWQMWLARFSDTQKHADAVLIPILASAKDRRFNDRGLIAVSRSVSYSLWLVDTTNGRLIWSRTKSGVETARSLPEKSESLSAPQWNVPVTRALTSDFWRDYPGRLVLD